MKRGSELPISGHILGCVSWSLRKSVCYNKCNESTEIGNNRHKRDSTMYDKIKLWMNGIFDGARQDVLASCLADVTTQIKHGTGEVRTYGDWAV